MENIDLDNIENMTPEEIESLMDSLETTENGEIKIKDGAPAEQKKAEAAAPADAQKPADQQEEVKKVETPATTATTAEPGRDEKGKFIATKNGEGKIPYGVLEAARAEAKQYREQAQQKDAEHAEALRKLAVMQEQLKTAGMKPADLPEDIEFSDEEISAIADDFPEVGKIMRGMAQKIQYLQQQHQQRTAPAPAQETGNPVIDAINSIPELAEWRTKDEDKFGFAVHIDQTLQNDPAWKDKSLAERFQEVTNRVKAAYGDAPEPAKKAEPSTEELQKKAEQMQKAAKAAAEVPASPSDLGNANVNTEKTAMDKAIDASPAELQGMMDKMSPKELEAFLSQTFSVRE